KHTAPSGRGTRGRRSRNSRAIAGTCVPPIQERRLPALSLLGEKIQTQTEVGFGQCESQALVRSPTSRLPGEYEQEVTVQQNQTHTARQKSTARHNSGAPPKLCLGGNRAAGSPHSRG